MAIAKAEPRTCGWCKRRVVRRPYATRKVCSGCGLLPEGCKCPREEEDADIGG